MNGCLSFFAKIGWYLIWAFIVSFVYVNGLNENDEFIWYDSIIKNIIASIIFIGPPLYFIWSIRKLIFKMFWFLYGINYLIFALGLVVVFFDKENEDEYLFLKILGLFIVMTIPIFLKIRKNLILQQILFLISSIILVISPVIISLGYFIILSELRYIYWITIIVIIVINCIFLIPFAILILFTKLKNIFLNFVVWVFQQEQKHLILI